MKHAAFRYAKNLLPWLVALGLFAYLFYKIPPGQVWRGLRFVNPWAFAGFTVVYFLIILALDNYGLAKVLSRFESPVGFRELLPARCVSYLLSIVNYNAGQAAIALYFKKTRGLSFFKTLGVILFIAVTDLYWIIALAFASSFFIELQGHANTVQHWVQRVGYVAIAALLLHILFWGGWLERIVPRKIHFGFFDWVRGRHLFQPFHHAKFSDYVKIALYRLPIHLTIILSMGFVMRLFQISISWLEVIATFPIVFLLGAIPLTPGGLGATQLATVELLKDRVTSPLFSSGQVKPEELLLAISLAWMFANYLLKALAGLLFLRATKRKLEMPDPSHQTNNPGSD
jgi:Predicted integral membrane protein